MSSKKRQSKGESEGDASKGGKSKMSDFGSILSAMTSAVGKKSVSLPMESKAPSKKFAEVKANKEKFQVKRGEVSEASSKLKTFREKMADKRRAKSNLKRGMNDIEEEEEGKNTSEKQSKKHRRAKKLLLEKDHATPQFDDKEKRLVKTATKGVVTLFNAVNEQQKKIEEIERNLSLRADEREELTRNEAEHGFLQILQDKTRQTNSANVKKREESSSEDSEEENSDNANDNSKAKSSWKVLDDNYMLKSKMKQYDESSDSESDSEE